MLKVILELGTQCGTLWKRRKTVLRKTLRVSNAQGEWNPLPPHVRQWPPLGNPKKGIFFFSGPFTKRGWGGKGLATKKKTFLKALNIRVFCGKLNCEVICQKKGVYPWLNGWVGEEQSGPKRSFTPKKCYLARLEVTHPWILRDAAYFWMFIKDPHLAFRNIKINKYR